MINFIRLIKSGEGFTTALAMSVRKSLNTDVVSALLTSKEKDLPLSIPQIESHYLAGGNIKELVNACVKMQDMQIEYNVNELMALDLGYRNIGSLVNGFSIARSKYPYLTFKEYTKRYFLGEDVIDKSLSDSFIPWKETKSWLVRVNHGQLTLDEIQKLKIQEMNNDIEMYDPITDKWISIEDL
ncbi:hypothetical protein DNH61_24705 [Paenibacillus sambharensis]|uniref:Uncharacterized protein n=1 Tax=Paenibacillus sambharensis TaxID=1803190 RepID=A0A2W1LDJ7_9BACL|nr:flotillin-like FloA family protein [Paenibacillus sambharensis]PZD93135.1 hypothetical protein DNH61_24705 [Paenibacillus sambharensis]